ncbi:MAG TPA: DUF4339 domain-containing protein [Myxococcales bacterium]|nr:DUF4339 domain-containing protein [Myxococcales bacterium]
MRNRIRTALRHPRALDEVPENEHSRAHCRPVAGPEGRLQSARTMKLQVRHAGGELTVGSHKEFLLLWRRGIVAPDDLVRREGQSEWTKAGELPWIRGMRVQGRRDSRRLLWLTLSLLVLALFGAFWIQRHAPQVARRSGALPPGSVRAVPSQSSPAAR